MEKTVSYIGQEKETAVNQW